MPLVNEAKKVINVKIVCFGPPLAGKATTLQQAHRNLPQEKRGTLKTMPVQGDRLLFFDYTSPERESIGGYALRFHVYTVCGDTAGTGAWKLVLKGVDGILFVADSDPERLELNRASLMTLETLLPDFGSGGIPAVFQYNKRDLSGAVPMADMHRLLNTMNVPSFPSAAKSGEGVYAAFSALTEMVVNRLRRSHPDLAADTEEPNAPAAPSFPSPLDDPHPAGEVAVPVVSLQPEAPLHLQVTLEQPLHDGPGEIRLPLRIRYPGGEKQYYLTVLLEEGD